MTLRCQASARRRNPWSPPAASKTVLMPFIMTVVCRPCKTRGVREFGPIARAAPGRVQAADRTTAWAPCSSRCKAALAPYGSRYRPISNKTFGGEVLPDTETVMGYSPSAISGTVKFTWNWPAATNPANDTVAAAPPIVTPTPLTGVGEPITAPDGEGAKPAQYS